MYNCKKKKKNVSRQSSRIASRKNCCLWLGAKNDRDPQIITILWTIKPFEAHLRSARLGPSSGTRKTLNRYLFPNISKLVQKKTQRRLVFSTHFVVFARYLLKLIVWYIASRIFFLFTFLYRFYLEKLVHTDIFFFSGVEWMAYWRTRQDWKLRGYSRDITISRVPIGGHRRMITCACFVSRKSWNWCTDTSLATLRLFPSQNLEKAKLFFLYFALFFSLTISSFNFQQGMVIYNKIPFSCPISCT